MNEKLTVFRAGTKDGPSFSFSGDHSVRVKSGVRQQTLGVWMVTKSDLYYPLKQGEKTTVRLFKADVWPSDFDELKVKNHSKYSGICLAESESTKQLKEQLESLDWKEIKPETCSGGMSLMDFSTLVRAVMVYMKDHYPTTPDEYNFQAELKAASHWFWYPKSNENPGHEEEACTLIKPPELVSGPHKDNRVKIAALETCRKWISVLEGLKKESSPNKRSKRVKEDEDSSPDEDENEERIYDLEESIFDLKTYFDFKVRWLVRKSRRKAKKLHGGNCTCEGLQESFHF
ncbi:uncharacterized protein [Pocillopora verrucosa]|uniref:uncharacterized protein isoform X2 n=1 Tax=Pocillopora verrucosa TaxID=203993 RepID=UPI0033413DD8